LKIIFATTQNKRNNIYIITRVNIGERKFNNMWNSGILIYIPIVLIDTLDKYNRSIGYYNDICYTTTIDDGNDILLKYRQKEFINKDNIVCQEGYDFSEYDYRTFDSKFSCEVNDCPQTFADMSINKRKLLDNFKSI